MSKEEIIGQLEKLYANVHGQDNPSQLEIDILKDEIKALYKKVLDWEEGANRASGDRQSELHVVQPAEPEPIAEEPAQEAQPEPQPEASQIETPDYTPSYEEAVQAPEPEPVSAPELPQPQPEPQPIVEEPKPEPTPEPQPAVTQNEQQTQEKKEHNIAERAEAAQEDKSLAAKWHKNPISDLKNGIGLNEKFAFVRILFKGDLNAYNEAIEKLNTSGSRDNAMVYLDNLRGERDWDAKSLEFQTLKEFVGRRFS